MTQTTTPGITLIPSQGPDHAPSSAARTGLEPNLPVQRYDLDGAGGTVTLTDFVAEAGMHFEVAVFPTHDSSLGLDEAFGSTYVWFRLRTAEATLAARDQYGHDGSAELPWFVADQWNLAALDLTGLEGQQVTLEMTVAGGHRGHGHVHLLGQHPVGKDSDDPVELVQTRRGSHSRRGHSRGNTYPLVGLPHGFNFVAPMSDAHTTEWIFTWHPDGGPQLQSLAFCHAPSPWIGDRANVGLMPWTGQPHTNPAKRALGYDPRQMVDRVDLFRLPLCDGTVAEVTPTDHAAVFRFTFADDATRRGTIVDIALEGRPKVDQLPDGRVAISGHIAPEDPWNRRRPDPTGYFYGVTRQKAHLVEPRANTLFSLIGRGQRPQAAVIELDEGTVLEVAMATSFISVDQARHNLCLEIGEASFDEVQQRAHDVWADLLGRLQVSGTTHEQKVAAYSNLARLHLWPNSMAENAGTNQTPHWVHASPFAPIAEGDDTTATTAPVAEGRIMVNNGYWDTYRTCWPAYNLFTPDLAGDLTDGLLAAWRESGWMGRWSAPGHVDCMVGTSSDQIFADASRHGIDFDEVAAYDSALRNACCPSEDSCTGRKGIGRGRFTGWIGAETDEGLSWTIENAISDAAIALWSSRLADRAAELGISERVEELRTNALWFTNRSLGHRALFDPATGFHRGRLSSGEWSRENDPFDPLRWGDDYTETNAWGMSVSTVQDGLGLTELRGGPSGLREHLDRLFATPEPADSCGGYGEIIHEIVESRSLRFGQCALSNQPAHHIPWMYAFTDQPWQVAERTHEALRRLFVGGDIGQGYCGDEDNGEMSTWWLFAALGLYPLFPGSGEYVIGAPAFGMRFERPDGALEVRRHGDGAHVASLTVNGQPWTAITIGVEHLQGEVVLDFKMTDGPSDFGLGSHPASMGRGLGPDCPELRTDLTASATLQGESPAWLVDDLGERVSRLEADQPFTMTWQEPCSPRLLVLTGASPCELSPVVNWTSEGQTRQLELPTREVRWPDQSLAWQLDELEGVSEFSLSFADGAALRQVELY